MKKIIKNTLKRVLPNKLIQCIRLGKSYSYYTNLIKKIEKEPYKYDYLLGTPIHTNLGDHLITLAEYTFLSDIKNKREVIEIPTEVFQIYKSRLKNAIPKSSNIFINGGGWMGNLWPKEELIIQDMVRIFQNNHIIIFPQTIYFDKDKTPYVDLINSGKDSFEKCDNLTICVRDRQSYDFAKKNYPNIKCLLLPDIALAYKDEALKIRSNDKNKVVKFCLRKDREVYRKADVEEKIKNIFELKKFEIGNIDTMAEKRIPFLLREKTVKSRMKEFSQCSFIVTDRLHGMIFSYLSGTPCIVLDNKTHKVEGVYKEWLKNSSIILPLFDELNKAEIISFIDKVDNKKITEDLVFDYTKLKEEILNG